MLTSTNIIIFLFVVLVALRTDTIAYKMVRPVIKLNRLVKSSAYYNVHAQARQYSMKVAASAGNEAAVKHLNVYDFDKILKGQDRKQYQIVDVREKDEVRSLSLPGDDVINLPLSESSSWIKQVGEGGKLDPSKPVLCFCLRGGRSMTASTLMVSEGGVKDVTSIDGGMTAYIENIDPSIKPK